MREEQAITHKTKDLYIVESVPKLDIPGGERFKTGGQVELRPSEVNSPGTAITMVARMECALWPLGCELTSSFSLWILIAWICETVLLFKVWWISSKLSALGGFVETWTRRKRGSGWRFYWSLISRKVG